MNAVPRPLRVLIAKPGLDGHDVGAKIVCRALIDAGMEVVYTGLRKSPETIAETALQEDVDIVGISVLSGAHLPLSTRVIAELRSRGLGDVPVVAGGNIPKQDHAAMAEIGIDGVFPTGTPFEEIVEFMNRKVRR
jgi:methylmalonyl-CoA mutase, C-terminal domain